MKKLLLAGVACLLSTGAFAAPILSAGSISSGGLIFSDFTCGAGPLGAAGGSCAGLNVTAFGTSGIEIGGGLSAATFPGGTDSTQDILISFKITATAAALSSINLGFNGTFEGNSFAEVRETVYADVNRTQLLDSGRVRVSPLSETLNDTLNFAPVFTAYVVKDILLQSFLPGGLATISSVTQVGTPTPVPEPATLALFGTALLGLGVARRRTRKQA